jgi:hypothetical protein
VRSAGPPSTSLVAGDFHDLVVRKLRPDPSLPFSFSLRKRLVLASMDALLPGLPRLG